MNMEMAVMNKEGQVKRPRSGNRKSLPRESWTNKVEFLLATIGCVVGLGNIWRFPYLCYRNGGGAFLIPYMLMLLLCGISSLYMEMAVGQYSRRGPYHMLSQFCPLFKGLGLVIIMVNYIGNSYYILIVVWSMFYLFKSFRSPFPWQDQPILSHNESFYANTSTSAGQLYFKYVRCYAYPRGISYPGKISWDIFGLLLLGWICVYFCIFRGIKLAGKVVYFTALFPYCLLLVLLINNCLLPGAWEGISYFIVPRWFKLMNVEAWMEAAGQIFSSLGIGNGVLTSFSSCNKFNNVLDVLIVVLVNTITSILSGFVIFSGLGYLSHVYNKPVEKIAVDGKSVLKFVIYNANFVDSKPIECDEYHNPIEKIGNTVDVWATYHCLDHFLLCCEEMDFAHVEMIATFLMDSCGPYLLQKLHRKEFVVLLICLTQMIMGIPTTTQSGMYLFQLMEGQIIFFIFPLMTFLELVVICWIYGEYLDERFEILTYFPGFLQAIILFKIILYKPVHYGEYTYPLWASVVLGWLTNIFLLIWIPFGMVHTLTRTTGTFWQVIYSKMNETRKI
uniref:Transporter n=1 Tax=Eptatretus burgeri TaxID=7764 RepID=A0A8C4NLJ9_EPTBU